MCNEDKVCPVLMVTSIAKQHEYLYALIHGHPNCTPKGYVLYHRLIMENYIGRYLTRDEVVHHKDGNKSNNDISNLELMTNAEHSRLHAKEQAKTCVHLSLELLCPICGKIFYRKQSESQYNSNIQSRNKSNADCCCLKCAQKMAVYIKRGDIPIEVQNRISENIQDFYYEYNDQTLNDY